MKCLQLLLVCTVNGSVDLSNAMFTTTTGVYSIVRRLLRITNRKTQAADRSVLLSMIWSKLGRRKIYANSAQSVFEIFPSSHGAQSLKITGA